MGATIVRRGQGRGARGQSKGAQAQQDLVHAQRGEGAGAGNGHAKRAKPLTTSAAEAAMNAGDVRHVQPVQDVERFDRVEEILVPIRTECRVTASITVYRLAGSRSGWGRWLWSAKWTRRGKAEEETDVEASDAFFARSVAIDRACDYLLAELGTGRDNRIVQDIEALRGRIVDGDDGPALLADMPASDTTGDIGAGGSDGQASVEPAKEKNGASNVARNGHHSSPVAAAESVPAVPAEFEVLLSDLVRHPDNREPTAESVAARAESLKARGQDETIVVRDLGHQLGKGGSFKRHWQVLSGETRWRAAAELGWKTLRARAVVCDDAQALLLLAEYNSQRQELTAIDKARLIRRLCDPVEQGGGGKTREEAGRSVGYASGSAASNVVRLLELPKVWQDRVVSGELPETFARCLLPIAKAPTLMRRADEDWQKAHRKGAKSWDSENWDRREDVEGFVEQLMEEAQPIDAAEKVSLPWHLVKDHQLTRPERRLFEVTDAVREKLKVEVIEWNGKEVEVATNFELFCELQAKALRAKLAKKQDKEQNSAKSAKGKTAASAPKLSPTEKRYQAQRKQRADRERVERWRHAWLAELVSQKLADGAHGGPTLKVALFCLTVNWNRFDVRREVDLEKLILKALPGGSDVTKALNARLAGNNAGVQHCALAALAAVMAQAVRVPARPGYSQIIDTDLIEGLIGDLSIDVDHEWAQDAEARQAFYSLFTSAQLDAIAKTVKVYFDASKPKSVKVSLLSAKEQRPAALKGVGKAESGKGKAGKKGSK